MLVLERPSNPRNLVILLGPKRRLGRQSILIKNCFELSKTQVEEMKRIGKRQNLSDSQVLKEVERWVKDPKET